MGSTIELLLKFFLVELQPHAIAVGGVSINEQPVLRGGGANDRAAVDVESGHRDAAGVLLLDQLVVGGLHQPGGAAVVGEGLELGVGVGGVAVALHHRQVLVVAIGARKRAGLEGFQEHGAAGRKSGAIALAQLGGIALLEIGHTPQGVGMAACGGPQQWRSAPDLRFCVAAPPQARLAGSAGVHVEQQRRRTCSRSPCCRQRLRVAKPLLPNQFGPQL